MNRFLLLAVAHAGCPSVEGTDADADGYTADVDCDDTSPAINPGMPEICGNNADDNCDGKVDDTADGAPRFYADTDGDTYGDATSSVQACTAPAGYVDNADDCNDGAGDINPGVVDDTCDDIDDNCDDAIDESAPQITVYADTDKDGFGDKDAPSMDCRVREGFSADDTDCDDAVATTYPNAPEICNGDDDNCDEQIDEDLLGTGMACAAESCKSLLAAVPDAADGDYWFEDGQGGAFETACDMTTDGGGWTEITGEVINTANFFEFRHEDGPAGDYIAEWDTTSSFVMEPVRIVNFDCDTVVIGHDVTLPFTFDEWNGEWKAQHEGDDTAAVGWSKSFRPGSLESPPCDGAVKFGAPDEVSQKRGGEWGRGHNGSKSVSWPTTALAFPGQSFRWQINGISQDPANGTTKSRMTVSDISIWVR